MAASKRQGTFAEIAEREVFFIVLASVEENLRENVCDQKQANHRLICS